MFIVPAPGPACGGTYSHDWLNRKQSPFYTKKKVRSGKGKNGYDRSDDDEFWNRQNQSV
jgi:hypothetical protein